MARFERQVATNEGWNVAAVVAVDEEQTTAAAVGAVAAAFQCCQTVEIRSKREGTFSTT